MPASLHIDPWKREPDTRSGEKPTGLKGTLTVSELTKGAKYTIYRWDDAGVAFTYNDDLYKKTSFTATSDTYVYTDDKEFSSAGTTYYRCVLA